MAGAAKDFVRGSINNRPFRPGGMEEGQSIERAIPSGASDGEWVQELLRGGPAQKTPPGFKQGVDFGDLKAYPYTWNVFSRAHQKKNRMSSMYSLMICSRKHGKRMLRKQMGMIKNWSTLDQTQLSMMKRTWLLLLLKTIHQR